MQGCPLLAAMVYLFLAVSSSAQARPASMDGAPAMMGAAVRSAAAPGASATATGASATATGASATDTITLYVARRGWHIDIGFAVDDLQGPMSSLAAKFPGARYLFFGFGDRRYLLAKHHAVPATLAALWPGAGLVLLTALRATPAEAFGAAHVRQLKVPAQQAAASQTFIWSSLRLREGGPSAPGAEGPPVDSVEGRAAAGVERPPAASADDVVSYGAGPYEGSLYLAARPRYSALHTCNTWAAETLQAAGLPVRSRGVVFAGQLWRRVSKLPRAAATQTAPPAAEQHASAHWLSSGHASSGSAGRLGAVLTNDGRRS